jgi:hypothetical protein
MLRRWSCGLAAIALLAVGPAVRPAYAVPPVGGCPSGGFELFPTTMFPPEVAEVVDLNRDGRVCGRRTSSPFGGVIIDNAVSRPG